MKRNIKNYITLLIFFLLMAIILFFAETTVLQHKVFEEPPVLVVNQGLGMGLDKVDGSLYAMNLLVADRTTGLFLKIAPEILDELEEYPTMVISGNKDQWSMQAKEYDKELELLEFENSLTDSWEEGIYHVNVYFENGQQIEQDICFREMKNIKVLVVPITTMYSGKLENIDTLDDNLADYTVKVYPLGKDDLEWIEYDDGVLFLEDETYDLDTAAGRFRIWKILSGMNSEEVYDLVLGIVPENMTPSRETDEESITGFTYGERVSVVSLEDTSPAVTIAHEIGHCYMLGDEYNNGTFELNSNMVPYGMSGREAGNLTNTVEGSSPYVVGGAADDKQGTGTVIYEGQYPFDVTNGMLIKREMTSLMGLSGYQEEEYWTTTDIWQMMYRALAE